MKLTKKIMVRVTPELYRKAKIKSAKTDRPMAGVCREALQKWVEEGTEDKSQGET